VKLLLPLPCVLISVHSKQKHSVSTPDSRVHAAKIISAQLAIMSWSLYLNKQFCRFHASIVTWLGKRCFISSLHCSFTL